MLNAELIRLLIVADSEGDKEQLVLQMQSAIMDSLRENLRNFTDVEEAKQYLRENIAFIKKTVYAVQENSNYAGSMDVSVCTESFDTSKFQDLSVPAGKYHALKITIDSGSGKACEAVIFPSRDHFASENEVSDALPRVTGWNALLDLMKAGSEKKIRFYLLDALGKLDNILWKE